MPHHLVPLPNAESRNPLTTWLVTAAVCVIPVGSLGALAALSPESYLLAIAKEGPVEWITVAFIIPGVILASRLAIQGRPGLHAGERGFVWAFLLAGIYFAGEELSWGQHLAGWTAPEIFQQWNEKQETNLHNVDELFGQHLKTTAELVVLIWAGWLPLYRRLTGGRTRHEARAGRFFDIPLTAVPIAFMVELSYAPTRCLRWSGLEPAVALRLSEVQEMYLAAAYTTIAASLLQNFRHRQTQVTRSFTSEKSDDSLTRNAA